MAEYINRNELVGNLDKFAPEHLTPLIRTLIEKQPTADVVEVVRCGNCLNRIKGTYPKCSGRKPDDYCSDGIRRTDNEDSSQRDTSEQ